MKGGVYRMLTYNQEYPALIVTDQQFVDRLPLLGYGTNRAEDAQPLDMEAGVQVVEEGVLRVLLTGIGVGEHSFASFLSQVLAESGQFYLAVVIEVVRHVGGTGTGLIDGFVGRVEIKERFLSRVFFRLAVVPVQDDDALQQLVVETDQFLLQYPGAAARTEGYREPALAVDRIDAVICCFHIKAGGRAGKRGILNHAPLKTAYSSGSKSISSISKPKIILISASLIRPFNSISTTI